MNTIQIFMRKFSIVAAILAPLLLLSCAEYMMLDSEVKEDFKPTEFAKENQPVIEESVKLGPRPNTKTDTALRPDRRIFIDESIMTDYTKIIDKNFSQTFPISVNFENVEIREVMQTFSIITGKNILVGDEVKGNVKARIVNEDWDDVLEAILEIKNIALTLNPKTNIVRIHSKDVLTAQEAYNLKRKAEIRKAMDLNKSIAPVRSEIFKLFYSNPTVVKAQIEDILKNMDSTASAGEGDEGESSGGTADRVKMTVDARLGSLIVLGGAEDLNFIEKLINQIDVPTQQILIEAFVVKARDNLTDLYGLLYKPSNFNPEYSYPILNYIYPGPQAGSVGSRSFRAARRDKQAIAELGFIVVEVDAMGTPGRSKSFHDAYYGNMGDNGLPDQITAIKQLAVERPWMDLQRIGVWGHSGGGYASTGAILRYPDFYKVAVSSAGNHDNRNYEDDWGEKWQGLLEESSITDANGNEILTTNYDNQANQLLAKNLEGKLLLAHGMMDDNVPPSNTLLMVQALIEAEKDFDLVIFPEAKHGFGNSRYFMKKRWNYFVKHLHNIEPPENFYFKDNVK